MKRHIIFFMVFVVFVALSHAESDEPDLFGGKPPAQAPHPFQLVFSGLLDARLVRTGTAIDWQHGGPGLTRYGPASVKGIAERNAALALKLSQVTLLGDALVGGKVGAHLHFNYDDHQEPGGNDNRVGLVEAYLAVEPFAHAHVRAGLLIPRFSLEHPEAGWRTRYTITPSAINTWVGEELRPVAAELSYDIGLRESQALKLTAAATSSNDPATAILAWRGWALHDYQMKAGDHLRFQPGVDATLAPTHSGEPVREVDGKLGVYGKAELALSDAWKVQAFYWNSLSNALVADTGSPNLEYAWQSNFGSVGVEWSGLGALTFIGEALYGSGYMGPNHGFDGAQVEFGAWFLLASYRADRHRVSFRFDQFRVNDLAHTAHTATDNSQVGHAETLAYLFSLSDQQLLGAEYVRVTSGRGPNRDTSNDPYDDLLQVMYRLFF